MSDQFTFIRPGGNIDPNANQGADKIEALPPSRTMYVAALTQDPDMEKTSELETMEDIFQHFKPNVDVEFQNEDGAPVAETLSFLKVSDFSPEGMLEQSPFLKEVNDKAFNFDRFYKQLKSNRPLQKALADPATRAAYLNALQKLIGELQESL